jgi:ribonuclease VapC
VIEIAGKEIMISGDIGNRAIEASMKYGKAVGHSADLNFGDCFAYACGKANRLSLLYKGNDFSKTIWLKVSLCPTRRCRGALVRV